MQPESQYNTNSEFKLRVVIFFMAGLLFLLGAYTQKKIDQNKSLKSSLELLEPSLEQQKQKNQQQFDSLQQLIQHQDKLHLRLKDSLILLKTQHLHLKKRSNENKAAILRLHDVDSLRDVVTRNYRWR